MILRTAAPTFIDNVDDYTNLILILLTIGGAIFVLKGLMNEIKNRKN